MAVEAVTSRLGSYARFLGQLPGFLNRPLSEQDAHRTIKRRRDQRRTSFLHLVRRSVFQNPTSPYRALFAAADCTLADLEAELQGHDLEQVLQRLADGGVRIELDELKGSLHHGRPGPVPGETAGDFVNHRVGSGPSVSSGGSTGRATSTRFDLEFMADRAPYEHLIFRMLDIHGTPLAIWYPELPASTGLGSCLRYGRIGQPPARWFSIPGNSGWLLGLATLAAVSSSRLSRTPFPWPQRTALDRPGSLLDWVRQVLETHPSCSIQTYVSGALRICIAAQEQGMDLGKVQFMVGSERLSPAKRRAIEAS